jgi:hypothetical protein
MKMYHRLTMLDADTKMVLAAITHRALGIFSTRWVSQLLALEIELYMAERGGQ